MFQSEQLRTLAVRLLVQHAGLGRYWVGGPTAAAQDIIRDGGGLSSGEMIMLQVAFDFWNGEGGAKLADVCYRLDTSNTVAVATLLSAVAKGTVNEWIAEQRRRGDAR